MSSVVRSVLGAALLLTGASAAMAQTYSAPVAAQSPQAGGYTAVAASNNAPVAGQPVQASASTAVTASNNAPVAGQSHPSNQPRLCNNTDRYGGHGADTLWGVRAFWGEGQMNP